MNQNEFTKNEGESSPILDLETQAIAQRASELIAQSGGNLARGAALIQAMQELGVEVPQDALRFSRHAAAGAAKPDAARAFKDELKVVRSGDMPPQLNRALKALREMNADLKNHVDDCITNEPTASYHAIGAAIRICRAILSQTEELAVQCLREQLDYHRECAAEIEGLNAF